jgi:phosphoribosyl 1,2-cyclic phosphodiesterase
MKLTFIGTRAFIESRTPQHFYNAACIVSHRSTHIMIDCGVDWQGKLADIRPRPTAIIISHPHPDHIWGLQDGAPCPVYATARAFQKVKAYPIERHVVKPQVPFTIGSLTVCAFSVEHSLLVPTVGYRITDGTKTIFYIPDLVYIRRRAVALKNVDLYIGDGSRVNNPRVFKRGNRLFGHTSIAQQLRWCQQEQVSRAVFTHCGTDIVTKPEASAQKVAALGKKYGVDVTLAHDGLVMKV